MSLFDFFHSFFGNSHNGYGRPPEFGADDHFGFRRPNTHDWNPDFENDDMRQFSSMFDFKVMTDPFEMHQFFEQKVNEIMKSFMSPDDFSAFQGFGVLESPDVPAITDGPRGGSDPRDHYLKPGVKKQSPGEEDKSSSQPAWLDRFTPGSGQDGNQTFSSFRSVIRKSITLPDGTVKTEEIIRNSDGSEERKESISGSDGSVTPPVDPSIISPGFSGLFERPKMPEYTDPRYHLLKPGYEKYNPYGEKVDKDLDKQIEQAGIENLPAFSRDPEFSQPNLNRSFQSFSRRIVTLPNGVVETEEITRNPDGTEQRTVTHTWPDGTSKSVTAPTTESFSGNYNDRQPGGYDKPVLSYALRGVKDFLDMLFK